MKKKWISALVCMAMVLSLLPVSAFAEDGEAAATSVKIGSTEQKDSEIGSSAAEQIVSEGGQKSLVRSMLCMTAKQKPLTTEM